MNNWPTKKLNDLLETCDAGVWGKPAMSGKGLFVLRSTNMTNDGHLDFSDVAEREIKGDTKKVKLSDGDILVEKSGGGPDQPVGRVAHFTAPNDRAYSFANFIQRLRAKSNLIDSRFLFYRLLFLHKIGFTKKLQSQTTGIRNLKLSLYLKTEIPTPPLATQKQIVERLDKIAEAQKLNDELIQKTHELFQSLLHQELNPVGKNWEVKKLGDLITDTTNGFASRPVTDGVGQLRPNNVDSDGSLNLSSIKFVPKNYRNIKNYLLRGGDILFNNTNSVELVGKTAFIDADYDYVFSNHMTRIRANEEMIVPKFVAIFLQHFYSLGKFRFLCTPWVNQAAVNSTALKRIKILLPPLKTQKQIVAKLSAAQEYKTQLLAQKSKLKELFDSALAKSFIGQ